MMQAGDVYAFGMILWEMYMGQPPFLGQIKGQVIFHVATHKIPELPATAPAALRQLVSSCLAPAPGDRPDFAGLLGSLKALLVQAEKGMLL
jgi:mitogen-activated protein kinase kinase kinase 11